MADYQQIYAQQAERYAALVAHEDANHELPRVLAELAPGDALDVVETGAGTGRLTRLLSPRCRSLHAFDASAAMIDLARASLPPTARCGVARHDALPVPDACADLGLEGWAFGHALAWNPGGWRDDLRRWVGELERVTRAGGRLVLIETMGTGVETPFAGGHSLEPFHEFVVGELGFSHRVLRTDYAFADVQAAVDTLGFFFGDRLVEKIRANGWRTVPECTGVYWRAR